MLRERQVKLEKAGSIRRSSWNRSVPMWLILAVALILRILFLARPLAELVGLSMPDDAFYYFQIARNVARGIGSTFDGIDPTNGYHPLWMLICALMFKLFGKSDTVPIYASLALGAIIDVASTYLVYAIVVRLTRNSIAAICAMALYATGVHQILLSINGLETSLTVFFFLLTAIAAINAAEATVENKRLILLGIAFGMLVLARTDVGVFMLPAVAWAGLSGKRGGIFLAALMVFLPALVVVMPWLVWNFVTFGSLEQVSGKAYVFWNREIFKFEHQGPDMKHAMLMKTAQMARGVIAHTLRFSLFGKMTGLLLPAMLVAAYVIRGKQRDEAGYLIPWFWLIVVPLGVLVMVHGVWRWMIAAHYYAPLSVAILIFIISTASHIRTKWAIPLVLLVGLANIPLQLAFVKPFDKAGGYFPWQRNFFGYMRARIDREFAPGTIIASTDCGIQGYYSPHVVINLDCVVNNACFRAIRTGRLYEYLVQRKVDVLLLNSYHARYILDRLLPRGVTNEKTFTDRHNRKHIYYELRYGPINLDR